MPRPELPPDKKLVQLTIKVTPDFLAFFNGLGTAEARRQWLAEAMAREVSGTR